MPTSPPQEAEESYEDEYKIAPPWMMEVKIERLPPRPAMSRRAAGRLGGQAKAAKAKKRGMVSR